MRMFMRRSILPTAGLLLAGGALAAPVTAAPVIATAAVAPAALHAPRHVSTPTTPFFVGHGGTHTTTTSTNWSGYAATGSTYASVSTSFTQPAVDCSKGDGYSSFWVGLDGYSSNTVEQTGTEADCSGGAATYYGWYEMYPKYPVNYRNTVKPGDSISESVVFSGGNFILKLVDSTQGWSQSVTKKLSSAKRSSAEVIAEAPSSSSGVLPLADFGTVSFTGSLVDGSTLSSFNPVGIDMVSSSGTPKATVSSLSGGSFSDTWKSQ